MRIFWKTKKRNIANSPCWILHISSLLKRNKLLDKIPFLAIRRWARAYASKCDLVILLTRKAAESEFIYSLYDFICGAFPYKRALESPAKAKVRSRSLFNAVYRLAWECRWERKIKCSRVRICRRRSTRRADCSRRTGPAGTSSVMVLDSAGRRRLVTHARAEKRCVARLLASFLLGVACGGEIHLRSLPTCLRLAAAASRHKTCPAGVRPTTRPPAWRNTFHFISAGAHEKRSQCISRSSLTRATIILQRFFSFWSVSNVLRRTSQFTGYIETLLSWQFLENVFYTQFLWYTMKIPIGWFVFCRKIVFLATLAGEHPPPKIHNPIIYIY